jgi:hypothetical protein
MCGVRGGGGPFDSFVFLGALLDLLCSSLILGVRGGVFGRLSDLVESEFGTSSSLILGLRGDEP